MPQSLCEPGHPGFQWPAPLLEVESSPETPAAHGPKPEHGRASDDLSEGGGADEQLPGDSAIPLLEEADDGNPESTDSGAMVVDNLEPDQSHPVGISPEVVLPRHLAVGHDSLSSPAAGPQWTGREHPEGNVEEQTLLALRVLLNPTHVQCYVNATLLALAWVAIKLKQIRADAWTNGFDLIAKLTRAVFAPLDVCRDASFKALIWGAWSIQALQSQHDANEFLASVLPSFGPSFMNQDWQIGLAFQGECADTHPQDDHGAKYAPIEMNIVLLHAHQCTVQMLVDSWVTERGHAEGLRRALLVPTPGLVLSVQRGHEQGLDNTHIFFAVLDFTIPVFDPATQQTFSQAYDVQAVVIHQGQSIHSGHYMVLVRMDTFWYHYDDGRLPTKRDTLMLHDHERVMQIWATRKPES